MFECVYWNDSCQLLGYIHIACFWKKTHRYPVCHTLLQLHFYTYWSKEVIHKIFDFNFKWTYSGILAPILDGPPCIWGPPQPPAGICKPVVSPSSIHFPSPWAWCYSFHRSTTLKCPTAVVESVFLPKPLPLGQTLAQTGTVAPHCFC